MKISFITPEIHSDTFTGGIYCILKHANELVTRGHEVFILAPHRSKNPEWIDLKAKLILPPKTLWRDELSYIQAAWVAVSYFMDRVADRYKGEYYTRAAAHALISKVLPESDITIATSWKTAALVAKHGSGKKAYFCQHYESLFHENAVDQSNAEATYGYELNMIANSTWLKHKIESRLGLLKSNVTVELALNAIDSELFHPDHPRKIENKKILNIISYGGRDAKWKGFEEMAYAMKMARASLPEYNIVWNVYGPSLIPPDNDIASYNHLGHLDQAALAEAYRKNDILLSASWYESYPLFPIEAMSSGLATITTALGTEDYATHMKNCLVIPAQDAQSAGAALIRLVTDKDLREQIAQEGIVTAAQHNWAAAGNNMEHALKRILTKHP